MPDNILKTNAATRQTLLPVIKGRCYQVINNSPLIILADDRSTFTEIPRRP